MNKTIINRIKSFQFAFRGLASLVRTEPNARIHLAATVFAVAVSFILRISLAEWLWIILAITLVWVAELVNTSIEKLANVVHPNWHVQIGLVKDMAAAAVLVTAIFSVVVALIIFLPHISILFQP